MSQKISTMAVHYVSSLKFTLVQYKAQALGIPDQSSTCHQDGLLPITPEHIVSKSSGDKENKEGYY